MGGLSLKKIPFMMFGVLKKGIDIIMNEIEVHVEITNNCILQCKHCSSVANSINCNINLKKLTEFIKNISYNNKIRLILTGGEPLIRTDLEHILSNIRNLNRDIDIGLFTTGLTKKEEEIQSIEVDRIKKLKELGLKFVYLSVYSDNSSIHDNVTQKELSFERTINSIKRFISEGIETNVNVVIMKKNINNIQNIIKFLRDIDVNEIRLLRLIKHGVAKENWDDIGISRDEQVEAIKSISTIADSKITLGGFLEVKPCQYLTRERTCLAGKNKLYIDNKGDIYPCGSIKSNTDARICNINDHFDCYSYDKKIYSCMAY